jgi:nucleotide-binding universal stress UspA family protein
MKILVGYDRSKAAEKALQLSVDQARLSGGYVYVVHSMGELVDAEHKRIKGAESDLELAGAFLTDAGVRNETHLLVRGKRAGEDLVCFAMDNEIDEIIIGIKKTSKVEKIILGSNAQYVILKSPCPVMTIR